MVSTCGRSLKSAASHPGATHEGSTDLDVGAIWCRASVKGGPSSDECAKEGLSQGKLVQETRSWWASTAPPGGPAPRPPWACTESVRLGSLGEMHTCLKSETSCVPVRPCRGGPRSGKNTAGCGRTCGKQTGPPELPQIDYRSAGSSRDGVAILRGTWAVVRVHRLHDWASLGCGQRAVIWAASDYRGIPPSWLMYETAAVLSVRTNTCLPNSSGQNCREARYTAKSSRQLMCQSSRGPVQSPKAACPLHVAPQPMLEASVVTTICRDTCSRDNLARRKARTRPGAEGAATLLSDVYSKCTAVVANAEVVSWSSLSGVTAAADTICPRSLWNCFRTQEFCKDVSERIAFCTIQPYSP